MIFLFLYILILFICMIIKWEFLIIDKKKKWLLRELYIVERPPTKRETLTCIYPYF